MKALGFKPTLEYITETYGEGWELDTTKPPLSAPPFGKPRTSGGEGVDVAFAETARVFPAKVDAEASNFGVKDSDDPTTQAQTAREDQLSIGTAKPMNALINQVQGLVNKAESLESLRDDLIANFADLETDKLANVMAMAFAAAELAGMADVSDGR